MAIINSSLTARLSIALAAAGLAVFASAARADVIYFNNGDQLTGTILTEGDGKLDILTPTLGKQTVNLTDVKTFSTDEPIKILLDDGTVIYQKIDKGTLGGTFMISPGGSLAEQPVLLAKIAKINEPPPDWHGTIAVNGGLSQGTTNGEQLGASLDAVRRSENDRIEFSAAYNFASQKINGVESTTTDNWNMNGEYDYFASKQLFLYGNIRVEKDRINFLDLRLTPGGGVGYQWIEKPDLNFNTSAGLAWVYEDYTNEPTPSENVSARLAYHLDYTFFDKRVKLFNDFQYFPSIQDSNNYLMIGELGFHLAITEHMFSEIKADVNYDNVPAPGAHRTQAQYILGVGWTF